MLIDCKVRVQFIKFGTCGEKSSSLFSCSLRTGIQKVSPHKGTHSDESVPQSQMEMPSTPQPQWWEMPPASQSQGPETPSVVVSQRKRKTPAGPYAQSVRESYNGDSESESEFERFSKRKRRFTQKEQQSAEHSSMEENIRDMKCTLKLLYEKVEANEKSLKELKAR